MTERKTLPGGVAPGAWIAIGIGLGVALGVALDDLGLWLSLGVVFGVVASAATRRRKRWEGDGPMGSADDGEGGR